jgi:hypothetical protein
MIDTVSVYAELSLGLAGFSGVAAAFSGRDREFRPTEHVRLQSVLMNAGSVLLGCFAFYAASATDVRHVSPVVAAALASLAVTLYYTLTVVPNAWRGLSDPESTSSRAILSVFTGLVVAEVLSYGGSVFLGGSPALLVAGFSIQLAFGLWTFARLLTRAN